MGVEIVPSFVRIICDKCGECHTNHNTDLPKGWKRIVIEDPRDSLKNIKYVFCEKHAEDARRLLANWRRTF